jgi:hypothetical protein
MKRVLVPVRENRNKSVRIRESKISASDREALSEVQGQFDTLIAQIPDAKILLAGLAIGGDNVQTNTNIYNSFTIQMRKNKFNSLLRVGGSNMN